jgi:hypothetical protein
LLTHRSECDLHLLGLTGADDVETHHVARPPGRQRQQDGFRRHDRLVVDRGDDITRDEGAVRRPVGLHVGNDEASPRASGRCEGRRERLQTQSRCRRNGVRVLLQPSCGVEKIACGCDRERPVLDDRHTQKVAVQREHQCARRHRYAAERQQWTSPPRGGEALRVPDEHGPRRNAGVRPFHGHDV